MDTSGAGTLNSVLYSLVLMASLVAGLAVAREQEPGLGPRLRAPRWGCVAIWVLVAAPSLIELAWHPIYDYLSRQPDAIRRGELWRLLTSVVVQDGGAGGTVFNLLSLAAILTLAGHVWGSGRVALLGAAGLLAFNVTATFVAPSAGGGNSAMTFFLASATVALLAIRCPLPLTRVAASGTALIGATLLILRDAHGEAVLAGVLLGALVARFSTLPLAGAD